MPNTPPPPALESLDRFVQWATETAQVKGPKIVDWLYAEVPDAIHEFLAWHFTHSLSLFVFGVFLVVGFPIINFKIAKKLYFSLEIDEERDQFHFFIPTITISAIANLVAQGAGWSLANLTWLKIWLAPKVYLLETFANVIN